MFSINDDVIDGLLEEGFFDDFEEGEERTRALHAFVSLDRGKFGAQYIGLLEPERDLWLAVDEEDLLKRALMIAMGKTPIVPTE
jgi:hypothetical protein